MAAYVIQCSKMCLFQSDFFMRCLIFTKFIKVFVFFRSQVTEIRPFWVINHDNGDLLFRIVYYDKYDLVRSSVLMQLPNGVKTAICVREMFLFVHYSFQIFRVNKLGTCVNANITDLIWLYSTVAKLLQHVVSVLQSRVYYY